MGSVKFMYKVLSTFIFVFLIKTSSFIYSQTAKESNYSQNDSLKEKTYKELYNNFYYNRKNDTLYDIYAKAFLKKAYNQNDTLKIATGYYIITTRKKDEFLNCYDSLIKYAKLIDSNNWVWTAYYRRGSYYTKKRKFKKALENQIYAIEIAKMNENLQQIDKSNVSLGILRETVGDNKGALKNFKACYKYTKQLIKKDLKSLDKEIGKLHLNRIHLLSNSYRLNNKLDSANFLNNEAQEYRKFKWSSNLINKIRLNAAEVHYDKGQYEDVIDSLKLAIPQFINKNNIKSLAVCYYIKGMSIIKLGDLKKGVSFLKKMDSIYNILGNIYPAIRPGYQYLKNYHEKKNDIQKQLYYVKQLLRFDSITHINYAYASKQIHNKIDKSSLIEEQKELKKQINNSKKNVKMWVYIGTIIFILLSVEILRRRTIIQRKSREQDVLHMFYQRKFDELLSKKEIKKTTNHERAYKNEEEGIGIAKEVVDSILNNLKEFEEKKLFTNSNLTATSLAKSFDTNANYIARIIKYHYQKKFRVYINDLRIQLALERLRNDKVFKNYSIQAMAKEVGFKNAEPFSKAFKTTTGHYPSDFIKQLKN